MRRSRRKRRKNSIVLRCKTMKVIESIAIHLSLISFI